MRITAFVMLCAVHVASGAITATLQGSMQGVGSVPSNFVGFSVEVNHVLQYLGESGEMGQYAQVLKNLRDKSGAGPASPTILRWGGNSADRSCYNGGSAMCEYNITSNDIVAYKTFAATTAKQRSVDVAYVVDVNFGMSPDPEKYAVPHVASLTQHALWPFVDSIEIGNEMDLYAKHSNTSHHRNASYSFGDYRVEFGQFATALRSAGMPPKMVRGGTFADSKDAWTIGGLQGYLDQYQDVFRSMSYHNYPISYCKKDSNQTILGHAQAGGVFTHVEHKASFVTQVQQLSALSIPFWIGEGNSASCGGVPNVSNTFMSTLWVLDYLSSLAKVGSGPKGMNFHGGPTGQYTPVAVQNTSMEIRPLYYGLLGFAEFTANEAQWVDVGVAPRTADVTCTDGVMSSGVCCAKMCGVCGGQNCNNEPGGAANCCTGSIRQAGKSCAAGTAPCVMYPDDDYNIDVHAVKDAKAMAYRVLLVSKYDKVVTPQTVRICGVGTSSPATLFRISAPSPHSTYGQGLSYGGQTFDGTTNGVIKGNRTTEPVPIDSGCYQAVVPPMSAAIVTIPYAGH
eukprot:TRINITY_DN528_c11_g1_i1.p1 TRINITY_DN528_c11_g1~~TRINITY_DN528_c11_g1_i1.p1  ORF type:complete len:566 (+),score=112.48 TRINITY_DN528_c11_g1_i1:62-1759(+)